MTEADDFPTRVITVLGSCPRELVPKVSAIRTLLRHVASKTSTINRKNKNSIVFSRLYLRDESTFPSECLANTEMR